ncbi:ulp1 protease family, C-terminal catalytic domain-containing protein [Artemisia annua]|uniref:Ulp1 protease family, C-terminal catalytic domain-containing protein n=1 Tax=Artemisia annua TaxID=35608 RepID=A0A2U1QBM5_ARTAN|nr:ulp1 protease family, C-terminal catalytic domain-containing protein [Artemisia annua]
MKAAGKRKVNEGMTADKEFIEVSEDEEKKAYKKKKAAGKRKVNEGMAADNENIQVSEEEEKNRKREEPIDEEPIEVIILDKKLKKMAKSYKTLRGRATSLPLFDAIRILTPERKTMIRQMGFRELIDFPIWEIPTKLTFFVINSLETKTMSLKLPNGDITILPETVQTLVYLYYTKFAAMEVRRKVPVFKSWNSTLMKKTDHFRGLNLKSSSQSTSIISPPETDDNDDDSDSYHFVFQHHNQNEEQVDENAESAIVDETTKNNVLNDDVSASVCNKDVMEASDDENEEKNNDEDDAGNQGAEESDQQERKDDEDDAGNQGAGESGQQEGSGKNEDAGNDNKDGNNSEKKDANEGDGTKEATNQKNEKEEADLTDSQNLKALKENDEETRKKDEEKMMKKRKIKPFVYLQSPYIKKKVKVEDKLTDDEKLLGRSIFSMQGEEAETVFSDKDGNMLMRMSIQSLAPGLEVETPLPTLLEIKKLKPEEKGKMVFFPIISSDHYYLIVFNIEKGNDVIIDNSESDATYDGKYKDIYELVKGVFLMYLMTYQHSKQQLMMKDFKPKILKMRWRTKEEKTDCGVYMMAHTESYEGETAVTKWKIGLLDEKHKGHREQLDNLRSKQMLRTMSEYPETRCLVPDDVLFLLTGQSIMVSKNNEHGLTKFRYRLSKDVVVLLDLAMLWTMSKFVAT